MSNTNLFINMNIDNDMYLNNIFNSALSSIEYIIRADYHLNKNTNKDKYNKQTYHDLIKIIRGGKIPIKKVDMNAVLLYNLYDVLTEDEQVEAKKYLLNKLKSQSGGGLQDLIEKIILLRDKFKTATAGVNQDDIDQILKETSKLVDEQQKLLSAGIITTALAIPPAMTDKIFNIKNDLKSASADDIKGYMAEVGINNLFTTFNTSLGLNDYKDNDIKNTVSFLKSHAIFASTTLRNIVDSIDNTSNKIVNFMEIEKILDSQYTNLDLVITKVKYIKKLIETTTSNLKEEQDYSISPLDIKLVSFNKLKKDYEPNPIDYYIDPDTIKVQFGKIPNTINEILDQIKKRVKLANKQIPILGSNILLTIKDAKTYENLLDSIAHNPNILFNATGGHNDDQLTPQNLIKIESNLATSSRFATLSLQRKKVSEGILAVMQKIYELSSNITELVDKVNDFNLNESREHWYTYILSGLAVNANANKKYKYISFGILDFYKYIITTIWNKIKYEKNGELELDNDDDRKYLFFYHYHYKIIKKLYLFLEKLYVLKDLNIFYTTNTLIEIADCSGKIKEYLSLLNIYKYLLDDFYSKIGLGKSVLSSGNVSIYMRINDYADEKLLLGRQYGTINQASTIKDEATDFGAYMYNIELVDPNNIQFLFDLPDDEKIKVEDYKKQLGNINKEYIGKYALAHDKYKIDEEKYIKRLNLIWNNIFNNDRYGYTDKWQQYGGKSTNLSGGDKISDKNNWYFINDSNNKQYTDIKKISKLTENDLLNMVANKPSTDATIEELYNEREKLLFYVSNRRVPSLIESEYTKESTSGKLIFTNATKGLSNYNIIKDNNEKQRPYIAKIVLLPLLSFITEKSRKDLDIDELANDINIKYFLNNFIYTVSINQKLVELNYTNDTDKLESFGKYYNSNMIRYPLMLGFLPYSGDSNIKIDEDYIKGSDNWNKVYSKYKIVLDGLKIDSFKFEQKQPSNSNNNIITYKITNITYDNNNKLGNLHYLYKSIFSSLYFEQTRFHRDQSEIIFEADQDDKTLLINNTEKCKRLLDRYTNEDDYDYISQPGFNASIEKTKFSHIFSSKKTPDNESIGMFMSIPSKLSMGNGYMLLTFGYSGTGKTYTVFGSSNSTFSAKGILQTALAEVDYDKSSDIMFRCYEMYGVGLPYHSYWYDEIPTIYNPKRIDILIHHRFKEGISLSYDTTSNLHLFDSDSLKQLYLNNNNWFYPDIGDKSINNTNTDYISSDILPELNKCSYVPNNTKTLSYVRYDNSNKSHFEPRQYSKYINNKIIAENTIELFDAINIEKNTTYVKLQKQQIQNFDSLISQIDKNRKNKLPNNSLYNDNTNIPQSYDNITRIKATANNPESSRSIIFYEFVIKLNTPQQINIKVGNSTVSVWRYYVTLLIVDLPGQEDIKTSFVEKPKYDITIDHIPTFKADNKFSQFYYTYKENDKIMGTNDDFTVYRYNNLLQRIIKSSVYMNPLFKFMSRITPTASAISYSFNLNINIENKSLIGLYWGVFSDDIQSTKLVNQIDVINKNNYDNYIKYTNKFSEESLKNNNNIGSVNYYKNDKYIVNGLLYLQTNPFLYITDYLLENMNNKSDLLAPFEGYMINENVGGLITYLYNKIQPNSEIFNPQYNFATPHIQNRSIFTNYYFADVDTKSIDDIDRTISTTNPYTTNYINIRGDTNINLNPLSNEATDIYRNEIPLVNYSDIINSLNILLNSTNELNSNITDSIGIEFELIDQKLNYISYYNNTNVKNKINVAPDEKTQIMIKNGSSKPTNTDITNNNKNIYDYDKNILGFGNVQIPPIQIDKQSDKTYPGYIYDSTTTKWFYLTKYTIISEIITILIKYIFMIDIFIIMKKMRSIDLYFRNYVLPFKPSIDAKDVNKNIKIANTKEIFDKNYQKLQSFYDFYLNKFIYNEHSKNEPYRGIYTKGSLFRNGSNNKFLELLNFYVYRNKTDRNKILFSRKNNMSNDDPEYKILNKDPLIFSYLEPYENFFNSYSLLYVISNNDPNIKCYKQMELLKINKKFIESIH